MRYLTEKQILLIHSMAIDETGGVHGLRDRHAVFASAALPKQKLFGKVLYPTTFEKAAVYVRGIISGHPFLDGNKRTAMICASVFLENNGYAVIAGKGHVERFALEIVSRKLDIAEIARWLKDNSQKKQLGKKQHGSN